MRTSTLPKGMNTNTTNLIKTIPLPLVGLTMVQIANADSLYIPMWERGYVEGWSKLPMSGHDANYTSGTGPGHCYNTTKEGEACESGGLISTSGRDVHESK
jgi:hypothetical protein